MASAVKMFTAGVSDLDRALALFRDRMELREERRFEASPSLLAAWRLPPDSTATLVELSCKGYPYGKLRLAQFTPRPDTVIRADFGPNAADGPLDVGPKAIDFYVADPILPMVARIEAAGYHFRSPPCKHLIGHSLSEEALFTGPDELPVLLMVGHSHRPTSLRPGSPDGPFSEIATASVVCGDLAASRRFYGEGLGLVTANDAETPDEYRDLVCQLVGAPPGTRVHFLLFAEAGEASGKVLLVHFFERTGKRLSGRMRPGHLGFSLMTVTAPDLDQAAASLERAGAEIVTAPVAVELPEGRIRVMLVRGPNEEMFELTEG